MAQTTRSLVLQWYRKCLRSSRTWPGPEEEKKYIKDEAIHGFRSSKGLTDTNVISRKVEGPFITHYECTHPCQDTAFFKA
jgi:hypothetical protein